MAAPCTPVRVGLDRPRHDELDKNATTDERLLSPCHLMSRNLIRMELYTPQPSRLELQWRSRLDHEVMSVNQESRQHNAPSVVELARGRLYMGGYPNRHVIRTLEEKKAGMVVNCCAQELPSTSDVRNRFEVVEIAARDEPDYFILLHHLDAFLAAVDRAVAAGVAVFVHCVAGVNRSVALCAAYLILREGLDPIQAVRLFRKENKLVVLDNAGFRQQLVELYLGER